MRPAERFESPRHRETGSPGNADDPGFGRRTQTGEDAPDPEDSPGGVQRGRNRRDAPRSVAEGISARRAGPGGGAISGNYCEAGPGDFPEVGASGGFRPGDLGAGGEVGNFPVRPQRVSSWREELLPGGDPRSEEFQ